MNIVWSPQALDDLKRAYEYIAREDPDAADVLVGRIVACIKMYLSSMPHAGRVGRVPNTRELVIPDTPYIVPYRLTNSAIEIVRVYHSARRWPTSF
jgi:toxin ParE1/3/4